MRGGHKHRKQWRRGRLRPQGHGLPMHTHSRLRALRRRSIHARLGGFQLRHERRLRFGAIDQRRCADASHCRRCWRCRRCCWCRCDRVGGRERELRLALLLTHLDDVCHVPRLVGDVLLALCRQAAGQHVADLLRLRLGLALAEAAVALAAGAELRVDLVAVAAAAAAAAARVAEAVEARLLANRLDGALRDAAADVVQRQACRRYPAWDRLVHRRTGSGGWHLLHDVSHLGPHVGGHAIGELTDPML